MTSNRFKTVLVSALCLSLLSLIGVLLVWPERVTGGTNVMERITNPFPLIGMGLAGIASFSSQAIKEQAARSR